MPIAVKDEIDVAGEVTTFGTNAYGDPARADAEVVRRVRAAGAVIIGKTNVPELVHLPLHRVRHLGCHAQPVGSAARAGRFERWQRRGGGRRLGGRGAGGRWSGIDSDTGGVVRAVRPEASARSCLDEPRTSEPWHGLTV